jgi:hypothetical protein
MVGTRDLSQLLGVVVVWVTGRGASRAEQDK